MLNTATQFLTARGWQHQQLDAETIQTGFTVELPEGGRHAFPLVFLAIDDAFGDRYLRLCIVPFVERPRGGLGAPVFVRLLTANHDLPQARFAVDSDGDVELLLDIPQADLTVVSLERCVQVLTDYAALRYAELQVAVEAEEPASR